MRAKTPRSENSVTIVGGVSNPIGGVTTFVTRLAIFLAAERGVHVRIVDLYPGYEKTVLPAGVSHRVSPRSLLKKLLWLIATLPQRTTVHFNFSTPRSLALLLILPKWKARWILTLHHGNLSDFPSRLPLSLINLALGRIDQVVALSEQQREYYFSCGVFTEKVIVLKSHIAVKAFVGSPSHTAIALMETARQRYSRVILASGYPTRIYQHLELIEIFKSIAPVHDACLLLCLYGPDADGIYGELVETAAQTDAVTQIGPFDEASFNWLLSRSDVYVRANTVDSCGIAVHDAIAFGVHVVASDVCVRPRDAIVFTAGSKRDMQAKLEIALRRSAAKAVAPVTEELDDYVNLYCQIATSEDCRHAD